MPTTVATDRLTRFADALAAAQGELVAMHSWDEVWDYADPLSDETPVVSPDAYAELQRGRLPDADDPLRSVADAAVGIAVARLAIVETGSVLLVEPSTLDRAVSLLSRHLIVVVSQSDLIDDLVEGYRWLARRPRAAAYATFVTGPSRTADIERSLTIGVQGPSRLTVAVLG